MPDADGRFRGVALGGRAAEVLELVFGPRTYTAEQQAFIARVVEQRRELPEPPFPLDDDQPPRAPLS